MAGGERSSTAVLTAMLPVVPILVPLAVHFLLVCFALLTDVGWLPLTFMFSHLVLILVGLWAAQDKAGLQPVIGFIVVLLMTVLLDIIILGLYFSDNQDAFGDGDSQRARTWQFSAGMVIMSLLLKPATLALACIALYARAGGSLNPFRGGPDSYSTIHGSSDGQQPE